MAEEGKITLNVTREELSDRIDAVPIIEKNIKDILKGLPDNLKEGILNNVSDKVEKCNETVQGYQKLIESANTTSGQNKIEIEKLGNGLSETNGNIEAFHKQVFGTEDNNAKTIVARINNKVENSTYTDHVSKTSKTFSAINTKIGALQTKDSELHREIESNTKKVESIEKTLNGDKTEDKPGIINEIKEFESRLKTVESYQSQWDTIVGEVSTIKSQISELQLYLGDLYIKLGYDRPNFSTATTYSRKSGRN